MYIRDSKTYYYNNVIYTTIVVKHYSIVRPAYTLIVHVLYMYIHVAVDKRI